jgi:Rieske Fe-S protein
MDPIKEEPAPEEGRLSRRNVLFAGAGTAAGAAVLAACGGGDSGGSTSAGSGDSSADPGGSGGGGGGPLVKVSQVPVGGAVSAKDAAGKPLIVSQPTKGQLVGLSAICTHQGCTVAPAGKEIKCPCHGSTYSLTGENTGGPAPRPLAKVSVKVKNGEVVQT